MKVTLQFRLIAMVLAAAPFDLAESDDDAIAPAPGPLKDNGGS